jgi:hypothetical protein
MQHPYRETNPWLVWEIAWETASGLHPGGFVVTIGAGQMGELSVSVASALVETGTR